MRELEFGLIIPSYNYGDGLPRTLEKIDVWRREKGINPVVCVVDDSSTDSTAEVMSSLVEKYGSWCLYHRTSRNKGKGNAIREGATKLAGRTKFLLFTDCDLYYGLNVITDRILPALRAGNDVVILDRSWERQFHAHSLIRKILSHGFNHLKTLITGVTFGDSQAGMKGFGSEFLEAVIPLAKINGFAFDVEILAIALQFRFRVERISIIKHAIVSSDESTVTLKNALRMVIDLLRISLARFMGKYSSPYMVNHIACQVYEIRED